VHHHSKDHRRKIAESVKRTWHAKNERTRIALMVLARLEERGVVTLDQNAAAKGVFALAERG
jgi:hypothetical protein